MLITLFSQYHTLYFLHYSYIQFYRFLYDDLVEYECLKACVSQFILDSPESYPLTNTFKRTLLGKKQAEFYAQDIKNQTAKNIFIYFTNGFEIWFWNKPYDTPRAEKGFHSREVLERVRFHNISKKTFVDIQINCEIIDRPYQVESVKRVLKELKGEKTLCALINPELDSSRS